MNSKLTNYFKQQFDLPENISGADVERSLAEKINYLIQHDFELLVRLLYRIDVNEKKLKTLLKENTGEDAGKLIATLIIERQLQKIRSREQSSRDSTNIIDDDESW